MNLFQHLCEHHPLKYVKLAKIAPPVAKQGESSKSSKTQLTLTETVSKSAKYVSNSAQAKEFNKIK